MAGKSEGKDGPRMQNTTMGDISHYNGSIEVHAGTVSHKS